MDLRKLVAAAAGSAAGLAAAAAALSFLTPATPPRARTELPRLEGMLVSESLGPLRQIALHFSPAMRAITDDLYRDFLEALPEDVEVLALVPPGGRAELAAFVQGLSNGASLLPRLRVGEAETALSVWSKDRSLASRNPLGAPDLLTPAAPSAAGALRLSDWRSPAHLAALLGRESRVLPLPLDFDAGDFAVAADRLIADANLFAKNRGRFESPEGLREELSRALGMPALVLGREEGDVPRHHLSMYLTPLDAGVVLVGDPRWGRRLVGPGYAPGERSPDTGEPLAADDSEETAGRFERAARELAAAGLRVVRIPTIAFDDKTYLAYTNGVFETRGGRKIAYVPVFGVRALDEAAMAVYRAEGWEVRPVASRAAFPFHGTLGCVVHVVARGVPSGSR